MRHCMMKYVFPCISCLCPQPSKVMEQYSSIAEHSTVEFKDSMVEMQCSINGHMVYLHCYMQWDTLLLVTWNSIAGQPRVVIRGARKLSATKSRDKHSKQFALRIYSFI